MLKTAITTTTAMLAVVVAVASPPERPMSVAQLFDLIEMGNGHLRLSRAAVDVAQNSLAVAKSQRLPSVTMSAGVSVNGDVLIIDRDFGSATGYSAPRFGNSLALEARQTVYAGGAISAQIDLAQVHLRQAQVGVEATRQAQRLEAIGMYLDLYKADNSIRVYESNIVLAQRLVDDVTCRLEQGMALQADLTRHELRMESMRLALRQMRDRRSVINHRLCTALGLDSVTIVPDTTVLSTATNTDSEQQWQQWAANASPTLKLAALGTEAASEQLRMARSAMRPTIGIMAMDQLAGPFTYDLPPIDRNINVWQVALGVSYNISSLYKANKDVRRAKAALVQSRQSQAVEIERTTDNMQEAYTLYHQSMAELRTRRKSVQLARENYDVVSQRYLNQMALVADIIDASSVLLNAELTEADARANMVFAYFKMAYLAGNI